MADAARDLRQEGLRALARLIAGEVAQPKSETGSPGSEHETGPCSGASPALPFGVPAAGSSAGHKPP